MSGREVVWDGSRGVSVLPRKGGGVAGDGRKALFGFSEVDIAVSEAGVVSCGKGSGSRTVKRFEVLDSVHYGRGMTDATAALLSMLGRKGEPNHSTESR
jgi:hypothetical protein